MPTAELLSPPTAASLDNPLYYLENGLTVIRWVLEQHGDLLTAAERERLTQFQTLPQAAQALLLRMVMRTGEQFRSSSLVYPELSMPVSEALGVLADQGWIDIDPPLTVEHLGRLLRRDEWISMLQPRLVEWGLRRSASKRALVTALATRERDLARPLTHWWPDCPDQAVALSGTDLFRRVRLMFFGNLRQDWSEFVVTELGHQRYEPVLLTRQCRAFQHRDEVDLYLALHHCREQLHSDDVDFEALWAQIPQGGSLSSWLSHRLSRLLHQFGLRAERAGEIDLALEAYKRAWTGESRVRYFRVREKHHPPGVIWPEIKDAWARATSMGEQQSLHRIMKRLAGKIDQPAPPARVSAAFRTDTLVITPQPELSVERQVALALSAERTSCYYVENRLFTGLLALLCWPALYAPAPGAFFHPFQAGPADLYRENFVTARQAVFDECLQTLASDDYKDWIWRHWKSRQGVANPLISWPVLTEALVQDALACISGADLKRIFERLLADLRTHRSGFPDLIRFWPDEGRYELIEVKAPGDRLQDHQRHWLEFFAEQAIPARVTHVVWMPSQ